MRGVSMGRIMGLGRREACDLLSEAGAMLESREKYRTYGQNACSKKAPRCACKAASDHWTTGDHRTPFSCTDMRWHNDRARNALFAV